MPFLDNMIIFNQEVQLAATEYIDYKIQKFNNASRGCLILTRGDDLPRGDYSFEASYRMIENLIQRRDAYQDGTVPSKQIHEMLDAGVKLDRRVGPVKWSYEQFLRIGQSAGVASTLIGINMASGIVANYLDAAVSSLMAALPSVVHINPSELADSDLKNLNKHGDTDFYGYENIYNAAQLNLLSLNSGTALFGDRSSAIRVWIIDGATASGFIGEALTNANRLFNIGNINVLSDALGRVFIVSDIPALQRPPWEFQAATSSNFATRFSRKSVAGLPQRRYFTALGLVPGASLISGGSIRSETLPILGHENIQLTYQAEYSFQLALNGYRYKGGRTQGDNVPDALTRSPTDSVAFSPNSWEPLSASVKDTAGVMVVGNSIPTYQDGSTPFMTAMEIVENKPIEDA